jgi:hypothetical protein
MNEWKKQAIEEQLEMIERHLANAAEYIARNINVEGSPRLHLDDWRGKSGHPLWMRNVMIPATLKRRAQKEKTLENLDSKARDKALTRRKRTPRSPDSP